jgi:cytochrome c oxidase subunit 2
MAAAAAAGAGCARTPLSALHPAGYDAAVIDQLFWWMAGAAAIVWVVTVGALLYAALGPPLAEGSRWPFRLIVGGGVALPTLLLAALVSIALPPLAALVDGPSPGGATVRVAGEQWWWRIEYDDGAGGRVALANELRLPRGRRTHLTLTSADVIHAFWIPSLAGKVDMVPGRTTYLTLEPTSTGTFRGVCAEFCGLSHARMALDVVVLEPEAFDAWLAGQRAPAEPPATAEAAAGAATFTAAGCAACHAVRGTAAAGTIGPDLTHVGTRTGLADLAVLHGGEGLEAWLTDPEAVKPGARMPPFRALGGAPIRSLAIYLRGLR